MMQSSVTTLASLLERTFPAGLSGLIFDCDGVMVDSRDVNIGYYNLLLALVVVDCMHMGCSWFLNSYYDYHIPTFPFVTLAGAFFVAAIEIKSIREKAEDKVKKELTDVALLAVEIAKYKATPAEAAKAIADYFNGTSKKE
mgnify:FL=1